MNKGIKATVRLTFTEPSLGTAPLSKDIYSKYIESLKEKRKKMLADLSDGSERAEAETLPEIDETKGVTGFHRFDGAIGIYDYQVKGAFKEVGNILKESLGEKNLKSKMDNFLFIFPRRITLLDATGDPLLEPHGTLERPLRAMTMQGPRVSIAVSEKVDPGTKFEFKVEIIDGHPFKHPETIIERCLEYTKKYKGFSQWRNASYGRADYALEFEK